MKFLTKAGCIFLTILLIYQQSTGQDSIRPIDLEVIEVRENLRNISADLPGVITLDSTELSMNTPFDLQITLNRAPGIYNFNGAINTNRLVIRGVGARTPFGTNKIRTYFNGIPISSGIGESQIDLYNNEDFSEVTLVKGPGDVLHGSRLGGAFIIQSGKRGNNPGSISTKNTIGSFGEYKNSTSLYLKEKKLSGQINFDHFQSDGFRENSGYNRNGLYATAQYETGPNSQLHFFLSSVGYRAMIASSIGESLFRESPERAAQTWREAQGFEQVDQILLGLGLTTSIGNNWNNTTGVFFGHSDQLEPRPFNVLKGDLQNYGLRSVFERTVKVGKAASRLQLGTEYYRDNFTWATFENLYQGTNGMGSVAGAIISDNLEERSQLQVFGTIKIPIYTKLSLIAGMHANKNHYTYSDMLNSGQDSLSGKRNFDPILAPSFSLLYTPANNLELKMNVSRGFNYPSLEEALTPDGLVNPDIGPEKGWSYALSPELTLWRERLSLSLEAYIMPIRSLLVADRVGEDQYIGRNAGMTLHRGLEYSSKFVLLKTDSHSAYLEISGDFTAHKFLDFRDGEEDFSGNELTGVPDKKLSWTFQYARAIGLYFQTQVFHLGRMPINDANSLHSDAYTSWNASLGFNRQIKPHWGLQLAFGCQNITDENYASSILINATGFGGSEPRYYYPGPPRSFYFSIGLKRNLVFL